MEIFSFFVYICLLIPIAVSDFKEHRISNKYIKLLIFFRLAIFLVESGIAFLSKNRFESSLLINFGMDLFSAVLIFVIFSIIAIFSKNNMGFGDVKLFVTLGLYFGAGTAIEIILFSMILIIHRLFIDIKNYKEKYRQFSGCPICINFSNGFLLYKIDLTGVVADNNT